jgi:hypothetical protein
MHKLKLAVRAMFFQRKDDDGCRRAILDIQTSGSGLFRSDRDLRRVRWGAEPDPLPESGRPHRNDAGGLRRLTSVLRASSGGLWSTPITRMRRPAVDVCRFLLHRHVQRSSLEARDREASKWGSAIGAHFVGANSFYTARICDQKHLFGMSQA